MKNKLQNAFDQIHASDQLKEKTLSYLHQHYNKQHNIRKPLRLKLTVVCSMLLVFIGFSGFMFFSPVSYVDMDINPSLELTLNRFGYVIQAKGYNDEGTNILNNVNIKFKSYSDATQALLDTIISAGYFTNNDLVSITIQTGNNTIETTMLNQLNQVVSTSLASHHLNAQTDIFPVSKDVLSHAHNHHVSPAKYIAITELQLADESFTFEESSEHSIGELKDMLEQHNTNHHYEQKLGADNTMKETQSIENQDVQETNHNGNDHH